MQTHFVPKIMYQNLPLIFWQLYYGKISFIVLLSFLCISSLSLSLVLAFQVEVSTKEFLWMIERMRLRILTTNQPVRPTTPPLHPPQILRPRSDKVDKRVTKECDAQHIFLNFKD